MMKKDIAITASSKTGMINLLSTRLGINGENLQGNIIVSFSDEFVDGTAIMEIQRDDTKNYITMTKENEKYYLPILSSLLNKTGMIIMQIKITEGTDNEAIPIWKSNRFYLKVEEAINATATMPEEYPTWLEQANTKLNAMDEALTEVDNLDIDVSKSGTTATVSITKKDGTNKSVQIIDGEKGDTGSAGADAKINGVNTLTIEAGTNITLDQEGNTLTINSTASGGSSDYEDLDNLPKVNNVELKGNKSLNDLGIQPIGDYALESDIPDVSNFITKDVDNLTYYTKSTDMQTAINNAVGTERTARENADNSLQNQIDAITVSSDVVDVVSTYQDLVDYDTSHIKANDIIKVMQDSTHNNAISYYRWVIVNHVGSWVYVGSEGPYYTKSEADTLLNAKQNTITTTNKLQSDLVDDTNQANLFVTSAEKTTWDNKLDQSDLADYVKNTNYATSSKGGVIKTGSLINVNSNGIPYGTVQTFSQYSVGADANFISKGTLENVITGKNLETANNKVTSISSSSTDVQYPSAKCVYDNDVIIKDDVNTKYDYLFSLTNLFGKITGTGTSVTLNDTSNTIMKLNLDTTTSSQENIPTPSYPQTIHTISGNNEIKINNKNLLNISSNSVTNRGVTVSINDNNLKISGTASQNYPVDKNVMPLPLNNIIPAGTYTFSVSGTYNGTATPAVNWELLDENDNLITGFSLGDAENKYYQNVTTSVPIAKIKFYRNMTQNITIDFNLYIQLEEGSTPTTFEKFKQQTYSVNLGDIEFCKVGDYKDVLFKNTTNSEYYDSSLELNKWYKLNNIGKTVLNGSEGWYKFALTYSSSQYLFRTAIDNLKKMPNSVANILSNKFQNRTYYEINNSGLEGVCNLNNYSICCISARQFDDYTKEQFETWLSNNNTTIYYPLETPTYTLLNDTLQTQLDNLQYALAYDTQTNISQTNTDLPFIINAETYKEVDLTNYVKNTNYATSNNAGVLKPSAGLLVNSSNGNAYCEERTYAQYQNSGGTAFISKGTLENVLRGYGLIE